MTAVNNLWGRILKLEGGLYDGESFRQLIAVVMWSVMKGSTTGRSRHGQVERAKMNNDIEMLATRAVRGPQFAGEHCQALPICPRGCLRVQTMSSEKCLSCRRRVLLGRTWGRYTLRSIDSTHHTAGGARYAAGRGSCYRPTSRPTGSPPVSRTRCCCCESPLPSSLPLRSLSERRRSVA